MVYTTDITGAVNTSATPKQRAGIYQLGPYLERVPENPFTAIDTVVDWGTSNTTTLSGWEYRETTGEIRAALDTIDANHQTY